MVKNPLANAGHVALIPGLGRSPGGEEFNLGPEMRHDRSELLCNKVLLKYKEDRESF